MREAIYERELPLVDTPAQDTLAEREIDLERRIDSLAELEDADRKEGNESRADVWRNLREKAEAKRKRQHSHAEAR